MTATLADGSALPDWLSFDADTLTFSGTPAAGNSEIIDVIVTATDSANQSVSVDFNLNVGNVNVAPVLANEVDDQLANSQREFTFEIPVDTFTDVNPGDALALSALLVDGSPLPNWLSFDANTSTFSGTPDEDDIGAIEVRVHAIDTGGLLASDTFTLTINEFNSVPVANPDFASLVLPPTQTAEEFRVNTATEGSQFCRMGGKV